MVLLPLTVPFPLMSISPYVPLLLMVALSLNTTTFMLLPSELIVPTPVNVRVSMVFPPLTVPLLLKVRRLKEPSSFLAVEVPETASKITS